MKQTKLVSLIETVFSTVVGFLLSFTLQYFIFPVYGVHVSVETNLQLTGIFTVLSIARGYAIRRLFNSDIWSNFKLLMFKINRFFAMRKKDIHMNCDCCSENFRNISNIKVEINGKYPTKRR